MVTVIDPQIAGISGDMILCALVNSGANKSKIIEGIKLAEKYMTGSKINFIDFKPVTKEGISATELILEFEDASKERNGIQIKECIDKSSKELGLSDKAKTFAVNTIDTLLLAESKIHGVSLTSVHLHEASSIDTVIDIIGTAIALDDLNLFDDDILTMPVAVGGGTVTFSHGTFSNPASAILEIFKDSEIVISGGQTDQEIATPTGASILVNLATKCTESFPKMKIQSIGYGAGKKNFEGFSNVLKLVIGQKTKIYNKDNVQILETNLDDVSGEVLGNLIEKIMEKGAKDVTISSAITKKGRPTNLVSIICDTSSMNEILNLLFLETGTLGVRVSTSERFIVPRTITEIPIKIQNQNFSVRCKISNYSDTERKFKIESDDIKSISNSINSSYKETEEILKKLISEKLGLK